MRSSYVEELRHPVVDGHWRTLKRVRGGDLQGRPSTSISEERKGEERRGEESRGEQRRGEERRAEQSQVVRQAVHGNARCHRDGGEVARMARTLLNPTPCAPEPGGALA